MWKARSLAVAGVAIALAVPVLTAPAASTAAPTAKVLVVGDSLGELSSPYLEQYLPGVELTVNAVGGSNTFEILDFFEESYDPSQSVIVFDGGTNDNPNYPQILEENLAKVAATVGNRCMVVPTVHGYTVEGTDNHGKNRVVHEFAAARPGTQVPDWGRVANTRPDLMQSDGLHPTEEGAQYRAQLVADGIIGCLTVAESTPGPVAETASASTVETEQIPPVGKIAKREEELFGELGGELLRRVAALTAMKVLLPGA